MRTYLAYISTRPRRYAWPYDFLLGVFKKNTIDADIRFSKNLIYLPIFTLHIQQHTVYNFAQQYS